MYHESFRDASPDALTEEISSIIKDELSRISKPPYSLARRRRSEPYQALSVCANHLPCNSMSFEPQRMRDQTPSLIPKGRVMTTDTPLEEAPVPGWLLWRRRFTPAAMRVYQVIARAVECGEEIGMKEIGARSGCMEHTARDAVRELSRAGVLGVARRFDGHGWPLANRYTLLGADDVTR